jgi:hypothetical protein
VNPLDNFLPSLRILRGQPRRGAGAHHGHDRKNDRKAQDTQPNHHSPKYNEHRDGSAIIAAYATTETAGKQCAGKLLRREIIPAQRRQSACLKGNPPQRT